MCTCITGEYQQLSIISTPNVCGPSDGIIPFAIEQLPLVMAEQPYDVSLHLLLPATESNFALGNFMATLKLSTAYNESITTIHRPVSCSDVWLTLRSSVLTICIGSRLLSCHFTRPS